jgi:hypothetical protein
MFVCRNCGRRGKGCALDLVSMTMISPGANDHGVTMTACSLAKRRKSANEFHLLDSGH